MLTFSRALYSFVLGAREAETETLPSACSISISEYTESLFMPAIPFITVPEGTTASPRNALANLKSSNSPFIPICALRPILSKTLLTSPSEEKRICPGIDKDNVVSFRELRLPSIPARICTGTGGKFILKSSGK